MAYTRLFFLLLIGVFGHNLYAQKARKVPFPSFHSIRLAAPAKVFLSQGKRQEVRVLTSKKWYHKALAMNVEREVLNIEDPSRIETEKLEIYITLPSIQELRINGRGSIESQTPLQAAWIDILIVGPGKVSAEVATKSLNASISGSGSIHLTGEAKKSHLSIVGEGNIEAQECKSVKVNVSVVGEGNCSVYAEEKLKIRMKGSGNVRYKGNPSITDFKNKGSGEITSIP